MKKTTLLYVLLFLSFGTVRAQYAGFLGHKYVASGYLSPSFDYIKASVAVHGGAQFTTSLNRYSALSTSLTYSLPFKDKYLTWDKDYHVKVNVVNVRLMYMFFRKSKGALAPIGLYNGFFLDVDRVWVKGSSVPLPTTINYNLLWAGWEYGYSTCISKNLVGNLSFDIRVPMFGLGNSFWSEVSLRNFFFVKLGVGYLF